MWDRVHLFFFPSRLRLELISYIILSLFWYFWQKSYKMSRQICCTHINKYNQLPSISFYITWSRMNRANFCLPKRVRSDILCNPDILGRSISPREFSPVWGTASYGMANYMSFFLYFLLVNFTIPKWHIPQRPTLQKYPQISQKRI